jgi:squalene-associated FAD-dependent desaturase
MDRPAVRDFLMAHVHVVGGGLAGLSCAVALCKAGWAVTLYEAAPQAGGRCRSYVDNTLGRRIDNGNHLLMSGNDAALAYLETIGARDTLTGPDDAAFPFVDLATDVRWVVRPGASPLPWWLLVPTRRVPGTRLADYRSGLGLLLARATDTVDDVLDPDGALYARFWEPLAVAALNCDPAVGAAALLRPVLLRTFGRGAAHCRPLVAAEGLSESFVDPALAYLDVHGGTVRLGTTLRAIDWEDDAPVALRMDAGTVPLAPGDRIVVATPPGVAERLLPGLTTPQGATAIVNAHMRFDSPIDWPWDAPLAGLIGGTAQWIFHRDDIVSVTVSAADALAERPADEIAEVLWRDVARALRLDVSARPAIRVIKEKRATFLQSPAQVQRRPGARTHWPGVFLAGDWTDTGLPATIEGAVISGNNAAVAAMTA